MSKADVIAQIIPLYVAYLEQKENALVRQVQQLKRAPTPVGTVVSAEENPLATEQPVAEEQRTTSDQTEEQGATPAVTEPSTLFEG